MGGWVRVQLLRYVHARMTLWNSGRILFLHNDLHQVRRFCPRSGDGSLTGEPSVSRMARTNDHPTRRIGRLCNSNIAEGPADPHKKGRLDVADETPPITTLAPAEDRGARLAIANGGIDGALS